MTPVLVTVRMTGGAYLARCCRARASSTATAVEAAGRAASTVLRVLEPHVYLKRLNAASDLSWWALPVTAPDADLVGYKTAHQIITEAAEERDRQWRERTGPGSCGDRMDCRSLALLALCGNRSQGRWSR